MVDSVVAVELVGLRRMCCAPQATCCAVAVLDRATRAHPGLPLRRLQECCAAAGMHCERAQGRGDAIGPGQRRQKEGAEWPGTASWAAAVHTGVRDMPARRCRWGLRSGRRAEVVHVGKRGEAADGVAWEMHGARCDGPRGPPPCGSRLEAPTHARCIQQALSSVVV